MDTKEKRKSNPGQYEDLRLKTGQVIVEEWYDKLINHLTELRRYALHELRTEYPLLFPLLTADPTLARGQLWHRDDLGVLRYSPDAVAVRNLITDVDFNVHATRHEAPGPDPITGWIRPSHIGPYADTAAFVWFRVRNIADTANVYHYFAPNVDLVGQLGHPDYEWYYLCLYLLYVSAIMTSFSVKGSIYPYTDATYDLGSATLRWDTLYAVSTVIGEIGFTEKICVVCGKRFKSNDRLTLKVVDVDKITKTIPVHMDCCHRNINPDVLQKISSSKGHNPRLSEGEFEVEEVTIHSEGVVRLRVRFWDGTLLSVSIKPDASEEETMAKIEAYYEMVKLREREELEKIEEAKSRLIREWKGYRGKIKV